MKTYNVTNAVLIPASEGRNEQPYFQLNLANDKGVVLQVPDDENPERMVNAPIVMSIDQIDAQLRNYLGVTDLIDVADFEKISLVRTMRITGTVEFKEKGQTFMATDKTKTVFDGKQWLPKSKIKAGAEYKVQRTNYRIDYNKPLTYAFDDKVGFMVSDRVHARVQARANA